jgi:alpha-L-rhamnosidase
MMLYILLACIACEGGKTTMSAEATWIWYPGDFEIGMHEEISIRREERGRVYPPFWKMDSSHTIVTFQKKYKLDKPEKISLSVDGEYYATINTWHGMIYEDMVNYEIPAGEHELQITVVNKAGIPAVYLKGETLVSDESWEVSVNKKYWVKAGGWNLNDPLQPPSRYRLATIPMAAASMQRSNKSLLCDFGRETFGYVVLEQIKGKGSILLCYGESVEEALSEESCETFDRVDLDGDRENRLVLSKSRAFRYVNAICGRGVEIGSISMLYEYLPVEYKGTFSCSNELLNRIWDTAVYTLHLNTREFMLDGIKRDRWVWMGDAYQTELMNFYSFFEPEVIKRTLVAVRGKDPVDLHLNQIMDYSFYWFMGIYDYYLYTGDLEFIRRCYLKMETLMEFCLGRRNGEGLMEGKPEDWVYIDWADIDNRGEVCAEQILLARSLEIMELCTRLMGKQKKADEYGTLARQIKDKVLDIFWDENRNGLIHNRVDGILQGKITKHANLFALLFGLLDGEKAASVKEHVLQNPVIDRITTPYMRFYELTALCEMGEQEYVLKEVLEYWGGMLELGATSFWELFDPAQNGIEHLAMYGRPFGKSLCHGWGASPIYLLGKYFIGVKPLEPGYAKYLLQPSLGSLEWLEGVVPLPEGQVKVYMDRSVIKVTAGSGIGVLRFKSSAQPEATYGNLKEQGDGIFELTVEPGREYVVNYR